MPLPHVASASIILKSVSAHITVWTLPLYSCGKFRSTDGSRCVWLLHGTWCDGEQRPCTSSSSGRVPSSVTVTCHPRQMHILTCTRR